MSKQKSGKGVIQLLKTSSGILFDHKEVLIPFTIIFFIQCLIIEILFFFPRWPLNILFTPIILKVSWGGEPFLHYPANIILIPHLFQYFQMPLFVLVNSFFIGYAIALINAINNGKKINHKAILNETFSSYIHLVAAAIIIYIMATALSGLYDQFLIKRALKIRSQSGHFYIIKVMVIQGALYFKLILTALVTTLFAYVFPITIIDRKKLPSALYWNFKTLRKSFWYTFFVVMLPTLIIVPIFLLSASIDILKFFPELSIFMLVLTVFVVTVIDAIVYTALTTEYLFKKEDK